MAELNYFHKKVPSRTAYKSPNMEFFWSAFSSIWTLSRSVVVWHGSEYASKYYKNTIIFHNNIVNDDSRNLKSRNLDSK